ncbi:MAG: hypothetical protein KDK70_25865, partial [Myxococcales bacterium]|nr:hypothetical protein [Myxococcales bacterium]
MWRSEGLTPGGVAEALLAYAAEDVVSFHMPGHKDGQGFAPGLRARWAEVLGRDKTMIVSQRLDSFFTASHCLARTLEALARRAGADRSRIVLDGATGAWLGACLAEAAAGHTLAVARPVPRGLVDAALWAGLLLEVRPGGLDPRTGFACPPSATLTAGAATSVAVSRPHWSAGPAEPWSALAAHARGRGGCLWVDDTLGASADAPAPAGTVVVEHGPAIASLAQVAFVHVHGLEPEAAARLERMLELVHVSSDSYPLLSSADAAIQAPAYRPSEGRLDALRARLA